MQKILIVEDDPDFTKIYQTKLESKGYRVISAENGEKGLNTAFREHPDLILLDIMMPKMDGMTMLKSLRQDNWGRDVAVLILTNLDPNDEILNAVVKHLPTYYILKVNSNPEDIAEKIKEILASTQDKK